MEILRHQCFISAYVDRGGRDGLLCLMIGTRCRRSSSSTTQKRTMAPEHKSLPVTGPKDESAQAKL